MVPAIASLATVAAPLAAARASPQTAAQRPTGDRRRPRAAVAKASAAAGSRDYRSLPPNQVNVLVVGPTGYIGK